jgi:uncharacterized protein involved in oxidation of intracellular sulfur
MNKIEINVLGGVVPPVFPMGRGVELDKISDGRFEVQAQARAVLEGGGELLACGTCLELCESARSEDCPLSTVKDLYEILRDSDRLVTV